MAQTLSLGSIETIHRRYTLFPERVISLHQRVELRIHFAHYVNGKRCRDISTIPCSISALSSIPAHTSLPSISLALALRLSGVLFFRARFSCAFHSFIRRAATNKARARPVQSGVQAWKAHIAIRAFEPTQIDTCTASQQYSALNDPHAGNTPPALLSRGSTPTSFPHPDFPRSTSAITPPPTSSSFTLEQAQSTLTASLCYACHTQLTSRGRTPHIPIAATTKTEILLPIWVGQNLERRSDVRSFLLDED